MVKGQAAQYSGIGLAKFLFRNIGLLIKVRKDSQFKVKVVVFTTILRFVSVKLSQVSQLLTIGLYLGKLQIYNLRIYGLRIYSLRIYSLRIYSLQIYNLNNRGNLVRILVYRGVVVHNLSIRCTLASKINSNTTQVCRINLVKWVSYKARDSVKFKGGKKVAGFDVI